MQHENLNRKKQWVRRLESVEQPLANADIAWDRLHERLGEQKKNRFVAWYWAAAATMIIISGTIFIPATKKEQAAVKQVENKLQPPVIVEKAPAVNQPMAVTKPESKRKAKNKAPIIQVEEQLAVAESPSKIITPVADTITAIATAPVAEPPKKKLRVVHINQLDNYVEQKATRNYFTTNTKDGLIKIKLSPSN